MTQIVCTLECLQRARPTVRVVAAAVAAAAAAVMMMIMMIPMIIPQIATNHLYLTLKCSIRIFNISF